MTVETTIYESLLSRALVNFARCVVAINDADVGIPVGVCAAKAFRAKADKLQFAINAARGLKAAGNMDQACETLSRETV